MTYQEQLSEIGEQLDDDFTEIYDRLDALEDRESGGGGGDDDNGNGSGDVPDDTLDAIDDALGRLVDTIENIGVNPRGEWLDLGSDDDEGTKVITTGQGIAIEPRADLNGVRVELSGNSEATMAELQAINDDGDVSEVLDTAAVDDDGRATLRGSLDAGNEYNVLAHAAGESFQRGRATDFPFPASNDDLEVITGVYTSTNNRTDYGRYNFGRIAGYYGNPSKPESED